MFKLCYDGLKSFHILVSKEIPNSWLNDLLISQATEDIHLIGQNFELVDIFMVSQIKSPYLFI